MFFKRTNKRNLFLNIGAVLILALICILVNLLGKDTSWPNIISKVLIFFIAALSLNIVCGCLGEFALGHGGFLLIGYTFAVIIGKFVNEKLFVKATYRATVYNPIDGLQPTGYLLIIGIALLAAIVTAIFGLIVGFISLGRLKGDYLAIVTLGFGLIFVTICQNIDKFGGAQGFGVNTKLSGTPIIYAIMLVLVIILIMTFMTSRFGRGILAIRDDAIAAEASGIPVKNYKILAFVFSSFIAGLAGGLYAFYNFNQPTYFGTDRSIELLIIIVLGGLGSLTGSGIAALLIVLYNEWLCTRTWMPVFIKDNPKIVYGLILVLIMLFRSNGILGTSEFSWDWFLKTLKKLKEKIKKLFKKKDLKVEPAETVNVSIENNCEKVNGDKHE